MLITAHGLQKLKQDLTDLKKELERTVDERGKAAAEGDLKENSAYIFLTERATVLSTQISVITDELKQAKIQSAPQNTNKITFGHSVGLHFLTDNRDLTITLVGKYDARLKPGWVSIESPLGIALLGKRQSDQVDVNGQPVIIQDITVGDI